MKNSTRSSKESRDSTLDKVLCSGFDSNCYTYIRTVTDISKTTIIGHRRQVIQGLLD